MEAILNLTAIILVAGGTFFSLVGVLGYFRFPDVYSKLHTTGKVGVFGVVFLLIASAVREKATWGYALVLIFFLLASSPATSHAIASAAYRMGIKPDGRIRNDLPDFESDDESAGAGVKAGYNRRGVKK
ncbi:MAG: monovalent cation/H(+) antiporter subunit G [Desulfobacterales bacterium]|nr:monovalent cation/H(+) antiporter subunit G [Desulfobacterales bacterium]